MKTAGLGVVLNADDFGLSEETVEATIDCFRRGLLTSATIMTNMPTASLAVEFARNHPEFSYGVHFVLVSDGVEFPVSPPSEIPALVTSEGQFRPSNEVRLRCLLGRTSVDQIAREAERQLARLADWGVPVSHVDSHGHLHKFAPVREALRRVMPRFGIRRMRRVQNLYLTRRWKSPTYWLGGRWGDSISREFQTTDYFYMSAGGGDRGQPAGLIRKKIRGTLEVGVHPGGREAWRRDECRFLEEYVAELDRKAIPRVAWREI